MIEQQIQALIEPSMEEIDLEVVRVMVMGDRNKVLQIMLDKTDGTAITIDECSKASKVISALLDVEDPLEEHYTLEVSSPGIDRPLTRLKDFERFLGHKAKIELKTKMDDRRRFSGELKGIKDNHILIEVENEMLSIAFEDILKSKLVITDALLQASSEGRSS
ncbi:MAG: ribosome maturation factor RimP [Alphaproteobacteria bacterium]